MTSATRSPILRILRGAAATLSSSQLRGQCELAGVGIEYCWGKGKKWYRRQNKPQRIPQFNQMVVTSLSCADLLLATVRRFARKARAYKRAYRGGQSNEYADMEQMVKLFKTRRNALDLSGKFVAST
mmetsp:Transcript_2648/g.7591  ORF Transcript_2648/g.7591 Transcript_2648/m.7591 type:complete len:127 (+) Transcript_2648:146-526(+)